MASQKKLSFRVRFEFVISLSLILAILVVYYQTNNYDFVLLDDDVYITNNPFIKGGWNSENIKWAFSNSHGGFWIPLTWLTYMVDSQLHGLDAGYYHITNVIFHIFNTLLLFFLFRQMTGDIWRSGFIAALFAVHPVHVESVAWVSERKDLLFGFFWFLTMWSYHRYIKQPDISRYSLVILFFIAGLMSKPMIVTLPFVLLLCDYWPLKRFQFEKYQQNDAAYQNISIFKMVLEKVPLLLLSIGASVLTFLQQQAHGAVSSIEKSPINHRIANVLVSYVKYLAKMLWPHDLTAMYPYPPSIPFWEIAGACLVLAFISLLTVKYLARHPYLSIGWLWFMGTLVPVIGIIKIGSHAMADRYTYMTFIGLYIMIAWGAPEIFNQFRYKKVVLASAAVVIIAVLMSTAKIQTSYWANSIRLFTHAIEVTHDNFLAYRNLGLALSYSGELDKAFPYFKQALRINPKSAKSYNDIGTYLMLKGKYDDSIGYFKKALYFQPNFPKAHNNWGLVLMAKKKYAEAVGHFQKALRADPAFASAHDNLQNAIFNLERNEPH